MAIPLAGTVRIPNPVIVLLALLLAAGFALRWTRWGRHLFAIGGNERAAVLTGVPVKRTKVSVYMFCSLCAGIAGILEVGWLGTITTGLGQGMELTVIAAAVIGGANLAGGAGTAFGAVVGAALIEVIRNSLTLLGVSTFWQGTFAAASSWWRRCSTACARAGRTSDRSVRLQSSHGQPRDVSQRRAEGLGRVQGIRRAGRHRMLGRRRSRRQAHVLPDSRAACDWRDPRCE